MKIKNSKTSLISSCMALILCFTLLIGTTFAWFTDSSSSGINQIHSGNLDVDLIYTNSYNGIPEEVDEETKIFMDINGDPILWEPGASASGRFQVVNNGMLALKYQLKIIYANAAETPSGKTLADALSIYAIARNKTTGTDDVMEDASLQDQQIDSAIPAYDPANMPSFKDGFCVEAYLLPGESITYEIGVCWIPTENDNEFNVAEGLSMDFLVALVATQMTYENDGDGFSYDVNSEFPEVPSIPDTWDGTADTSWFDTSKTEFEIGTAEQLAGIMMLGNKLGGKTITLTADIDLDGQTWTPINIFTPGNNFTFDGGNHTIYNMTISGGSDKGLFDNATGTIKNVKIANAELATGGRSGFVAGRHYGDIINCHVSNSTIKDSYWAVGGIVGMINSGNIKNCSITNVSVESNGGTGGIVGVLNESSGTRNIENCSVVNSTINNLGSYGSAHSGGAIIGMINISNSTVNITNCTSNATLVGSDVYEICPPADTDITLNIN